MKRRAIAKYLVASVTILALVFLAFVARNVLYGVLEIHFHRMFPAKISADKIIWGMLDMPPDVLAATTQRTNGFASSTEYFNALYGNTIGMSSNEYEKYIYTRYGRSRINGGPKYYWCDERLLPILVNPQDFSCGVARPVQPTMPLEPCNNYWIISSRIPSNAPPNFIVMASANVDASTLRTRVTPQDVDSIIRPSNKSTPWGGFYITVTKGGSITHHSFNRHSSCRDVYALHDSSPKLNRPSPFFDLTCDNGERIGFLTPDGIVYPANE